MKIPVRIQSGNRSKLIRGGHKPIRKRELLILELLEPRMVMNADFVGAGANVGPESAGPVDADPKIYTPILLGPSSTEQNALPPVQLASDSAPVVSDSQTVGFDPVAREEKVFSLEESQLSQEQMDQISQTITALGYDGVGEFVAAMTDNIVIPPVPDSGTPSASSDVATGESIVPTFIFGNDDRTKVPDTTVYPHKAVGRLWMNFGGAESACSGAMIDTYHVLTAGHCVHKGSGGDFADQIVFSAGQDGNSLNSSFRRSDDQPYGEANMVYMRTFTGWTNSSNYDYDIAVITLDRNLGNSVGWLGFGWNSNDSFFNGNISASAGYPGDKTPNVWDQWETNGGNIRSHSITTNEFHSNTLDVYPGQSGSSVWIGGDADPISYGVASHLSYNDSNNNGQFDPGEGIYNSTTRITQTKYDSFKSWQTEDSTARPPTDRPDLVDYDDWFNSSFAFKSTSSVTAGDSFSVTAYPRNNGTAASGSFTVSFYASTNNIISTADYSLGSVTVSSVNPFNFGTAALSLSNFPSSIPAGNYYVGWIIDSNSNVTEYLEGNNVGYLKNGTLQVTAPLADDHGNNAGTSTPVSVPSTTSGNIETVGDVDWFRFNAQGGTEYTITTNLNSLTDTELTLFGTNGTTQLAYNDDMALGFRNSQIVWTAPATGTYYFQVNDYFNNDTGTYSVSISKSTSATAAKFFVVDRLSDGLFRYGSNSSYIDSPTLASQNQEPKGIAGRSDGSQFWVVDSNRNVYSYDSDGHSINSWRYRNIEGAEGIATDGNNIWIVSRSADRVYFFSGGASFTGGGHSPTSSFPLNSANRNPFDITAKGNQLWVVDDSKSGQRVFVYRKNGRSLGNWQLPTQIKNPRGIAIDPSSNDLWIANDAKKNRVFHFVGAATRRSGTQSAADSFLLKSTGTSPQGIAVINVVQSSSTTAASVATSVLFAGYGKEDEPAPSTEESSVETSLSSTVSTPPLGISTTDEHVTAVDLVLETADDNSLLADDDLDLLSDEILCGGLESNE